MKPDISNHNKIPEYIRGLLEMAALSQRGAAKLIGINERTMRRYCKNGGHPYVVQFALECLKEAAEKVRGDKP